MNKRNAVLTRMQLAALLLVVSLNPASAMEPKQAQARSPSYAQSYVWYDGDRQQEVWLDPSMVADFNADPQSEKAIKSISAAATIAPAKHSQAGIRLWQMDNTANGAVRGLKAGNPWGSYSAVFRDGPNSAGRMRALPGNIIIYLDPGWSLPQVNNWLAQHKLDVVKKLEIGSNIYLIKTDSGLAALDTANALYKSGEVKAAFPDWWQEVVTK